MIQNETSPLISKATVNALLEVLSACYVIRTVRQLFDAQSIGYDETYAPEYQVGARRLEAQKYIRTLDLNKGVDAAKLGEVIKTVLLIDRDIETVNRDTTLLALKKRIESDGYVIIGNNLVRGGTPIHQSLHDAIDRLSLQYVRNEWDRALQAVASDPPDAITAACSLLESTCKGILDKLKIPYPSDQDIQHLFRAAANALNLTPDKVVEAELKRVLGGASNIVSGVGVLRTKVGDAHGRGKADSLITSQSIAGYVVQLAGATAVFLIEILEDFSKEN